MMVVFVLMMVPVAVTFMSMVVPVVLVVPVVQGVPVMPMVRPRLFG